MDSKDNLCRPALKEINSNETTNANANATLVGNNQKQLTPKIATSTDDIHQQDVNQNDAVFNVGISGSNESQSGNNCSNPERKTICVLAGQPTDSSSIEDSLGSTLAAHLDTALVISAPEDGCDRSKSLSVPLESESSSSLVSSDNETFVECRSFSPSEESYHFTSALDLVSIADPLELGTSATEMNINTSGNTNEQSEVQLDITPTQSTNFGILNLAETSTIVSQNHNDIASNSEQMLMENEESIHLDVTTCILPEALANLIENFDANSFDHAQDNLESCQELQIVPTTIDDLSSMQENLAPHINPKIIDTDFRNVTMDTENSKNRSISLADIIEDPNQNKSIVLSWATVEQTVDKLPTNNCAEKESDHTQELLQPSSLLESGDVDVEDIVCSENLTNLTQKQSNQNECGIEKETIPPEKVACLSTSQYDIVDNDSEKSTEVNQTLELVCSPSSQPFPETPTTPNSQFPLKLSQDKKFFPKSPPQNCLPFNAISQETKSPNSQVKSDENLQISINIEFAKATPDRTKTEPKEGAEGAGHSSNSTIDLEEKINSTFNAGVTVNTTKEPSVLDQTFDGEDSGQLKSPSNSIHGVNNQTVVMENSQSGTEDGNNLEAMDITPQNPNETMSYPTDTTDTLPSTKSNESLSEKEKSYTKDEKDEFVEKCPFNYVQEDVDNMFAVPQGSGFSGHSLGQPLDLAANEEFSNQLFLNPSDFDFLLTKGNNHGAEGDRSSLLLRFDPLLGHSVPVNLPMKAVSSKSSLLASSASTFSSSSSGKQQKQQEFNIQNLLSPAKEEEEHNYDNNRSFQLDKGLIEAKLTELPLIEEDRQQKQKPIQIKAKNIKENFKMSGDVVQDRKIDNDYKPTEETDLQNVKKLHFEIDELEKKLKNEVLKRESIEKKLKEAEQREETLIERITEKDKAKAKMNGVIEAYEKAIAELISEKEHLFQSYEKQLAEVKADRDSNYHHLTSLETTFSDLHVKYEKSKEMTAQLKCNEEALLTEKRQTFENLRLQEQRYEKMKNHAMQQLEIANKKLESLTKNHSVETTKLKALLKKEEIARASMTEQLQQKTHENEELVKICDELINGQGN